MPSFNAEGLTYSQALDLIKTLKTHNIDCNIKVGAVSVQPSESQWGRQGRSPSSQELP